MHVRDKKKTKLTVQLFKKQLPIIILGLISVLAIWILAFYVYRQLWGSVQLWGPVL